MNAVVISVITLMLLTILRLNVMASVIVSAFIGGCVAGLALTDIWQTFISGLGNSASLALSYAIIGGFAHVISASGITDLLANRIIKFIKKDQQKVRNLLTFAITAMAVFSQNLIPVHVAFIPLTIPPLLSVMNKLQIDRRLIACLLSFGLVTPYMLLPVGFGQIFLNELVKVQIAEYASEIAEINLMEVMLIPALGMLCGLLIAIFFSYRKTRDYGAVANKATKEIEVQIPIYRIIVLAISVVVFFIIQILTGSIAVGALTGCFILSIGNYKHWNNTNHTFNAGTKTMVSIGVIMMAASGFAEVMKATGHITTLVNSLSEAFADNTALATLLMLLVGLLITMGIGSSFSTVPLLTAIYVPLGQSLGLDLEAIACILIVAAVLGDTGSPISEVTLATTIGLNADGKHDHIRDTVIPTFLHFNIPLLLFGLIAVLYNL